MSKSVTPGWKFLSIGLEGESVIYRGVDLWTCSDRWERVPANIVAAHPSYPTQRHNLMVYRIKDLDITFATGEVSNGVWVFCTPE